MKWDRYAVSYDEYIYSSASHINMMIDTKNKLNFNDGVNYLDVGCGTGNLIKILLEENQHLNMYGIDISSGMLKIAKEKTKIFEKRVNLFQKDISKKFPFKDNFFDGIISINSLYPLTLNNSDNKLLSQALIEIYRVMKKHSRFVISCPDASYKDNNYLNLIIEDIKDELRLKGLFKTCKDLFKNILNFSKVKEIFSINNQIKDKYRFLTSDEYQQILIDCGFRIINISKTKTNNNIILCEK